MESWVVREGAPVSVDSPVLPRVQVPVGTTLVSGVPYMQTIQQGRVQGALPVGPEAELLWLAGVPQVLTMELRGDTGIVH